MLFMTVTQLLHSGGERGQGCKDDGRSVPGAWVQALWGELEGPEVPCGQEEKGVRGRWKGDWSGGNHKGRRKPVRKP